jgi:multidrug efflux system membrane fusion protein
VTVSANLPGNDTDIIKGQVAFINNAVDITNGTILVKALFENQSNMFTPGQFVNLSLIIEQLQNALVVPAPAVQTSPKGNFVFVVKADNTVETRPVVIKLVNGNDAVLTGGLTVGETVVTDGQLRLRPGTRVKTSLNPVGVEATDIPKLTS